MEDLSSFTTYEYEQHCKSISHEEALHRPNEIGPSQTKIHQFYPVSLPKLSKLESLPSPEIDLNVIVKTAINRPKPCDGIFNKKAELVILFNTYGIMDNMITDNAKFVKIDDKIFLHSIKCIGKHTKKCD